MYLTEYNVLDFHSYLINTRRRWFCSHSKLYTMLLIALLTFNTTINKLRVTVEVTVFQERKNRE